MEKPEIVAICGSTRFIEGIASLAWELEKQGIIALAPLLLPASVTIGSHAAEAAGVKDVVDELFLRKIDLADRLLVYNQDSYIGESTKNEIAYATSLGKRVDYIFRPSAIYDRNAAEGSVRRATPPESGDSGRDAGQRPEASGG